MHGCVSENDQLSKIKTNIDKLCFHWIFALFLSGCIFATKAPIDNHKKNLLNSNTSSTCPHNMVNFGPLTAEISSGVRRAPANFNGFRILAALLHGALVVGVNQTSWR